MNDKTDCYNVEKNPRGLSDTSQNTTGPNDATICKPIGARREVVVCGKVSRTISNEVRRMVDGIRFKTINDVVEKALIDLLEKEESTKERMESIEEYSK